MTLTHQYDNPTPTRGGTRPGAGRPAGSSKPDSRNNRLTQRYSDRELAAITRLAAAAGCDNISEYIRSLVVSR